MDTLWTNVNGRTYCRLHLKWAVYASGIILKLFFFFNSGQRYRCQVTVDQYNARLFSIAWHCLAASNENLPEQSKFETAKDSFKSLVLCQEYLKKGWTVRRWELHYPNVLALEPFQCLISSQVTQLSLIPLLFYAKRRPPLQTFTSDAAVTLLPLLLPVESNYSPLSGCEPLIEGSRAASVSLTVFEKASCPNSFLNWTLCSCC